MTNPASLSFPEMSNLMAKMPTYSKYRTAEEAAEAPTSSFLVRLLGQPLLVLGRGHQIV